MVKDSSQAKTAKARKALKSKTPQFFESDKQTLCFRGGNSSAITNSLLTDLSILKKPLSASQKRPQNIYPLEDSTLVEKVANKVGASLVMVGASSKKRPTSLVLMRLYNEQVLDALELSVSNYVPASHFTKVEPCAIGSKPLVVFQGPGFSSAEDQKSRLKNMMLDMFKGASPKAVALEGIQHSIIVSETDEGSFLFRVYRVGMKKGSESDPTVPRTELTEMGPRFDFTISRERIPDFTMWKNSLKKPKTLSTTVASDSTTTKRPKKNKNISTNALGQTLGRIHLGRQDYTKLNTHHRAK